MNKDEVLRRAQDKKPNQMDEMEEDILNRGCKVGLSVGLIACVIIMFAKMIAGVPHYDTFAIYCFMASSEWFYKWVRLKKRRDLYYGILWCALAIAVFVVYLTEIF